MGTLPSLSPPDCFSTTRNLHSGPGGGQRSWLLGFQFWSQVTRRGTPKISAHKECQATAPKKEEPLGFPKEGDVRSEVGRNHSGNRKCGQEETCACRRGGSGGGPSSAVRRGQHVPAKLRH